MEVAMQHPVFMAFYMRHLDLQDQTAVRRWSIRLAVVCAWLAVFLLTIVAVQVNGPEPQAGAMKRAETTAPAFP
jgi:hypothetical protein